MRQIEKHRRAAGVCITCGQTSVTEFVRCDECRRKNYERTKRVRLKYIGAGKCMACGEDKERPDRQKCEKCAAQHAFKQKLRKAR